MFARTLAVSACLFVSAVQAMPSVDKGVWRPASWGTAMKEGEISTIKNGVFGHGLAQPYVLPCETATFEHDEKTYECFRLYLLLNEKVCESVYALYGNQYSGISLKTEDGASSLHPLPAPSHVVAARR